MNERPLGDQPTRSVALRTASIGMLRLCGGVDVWWCGAAALVLSQPCCAAGWSLQCMQPRREGQHRARSFAAMLNEAEGAEPPLNRHRAGRS